MGEARATRIAQRNQELLAFAQQYYPDITTLRQLTAPQLQHLLQLVESDMFLRS